MLYSFFVTAESELEGLVQRLRRYPALASLAAALLNAAGPFGFLGAQAVYLGQPALSAFLPSSSLSALAHTLEDPAKVQALARRLQEATCE